MLTGRVDAQSVAMMSPNATVNLRTTTAVNFTCRITLDNYYAVRLILTKLTSNTRILTLDFESPTKQPFQEPVKSEIASDYASRTVEYVAVQNDDRAKEYTFTVHDLRASDEGIYRCTARSLSKYSESESTYISIFGISEFLMSDT